MAKKTKDNVDVEKEKREKEWKEREARERKELDKKRAEKKIRDKLKKKRIKKKELKELKKIKERINLPYRVLFQGTFLFSLISFIIIYYGLSNEFFTSIFYTFFIFISLYLGIGLLMVGFFWIKSEEKKKEMDEITKIEEERRREDERRLAEEHAQLEENLREEYLKQQDFSFSSERALNQGRTVQGKSGKFAPKDDSFTGPVMEDSILHNDISSNPFIDETTQEYEEDDESPLVDEDFINDILSEDERKILSDNEHIKSYANTDKNKKDFEPMFDPEDDK